MTTTLRIRGGLALTRDKPGLDRPVLDVPPPTTLVLPLLAHGGRVLAPGVTPGQRLSAGDEFADGLVAPLSGTVQAIAVHPVLHPDRDNAPCVLLDRSDEPPCDIVDASPHTRLLRGGVHGLGGAGFATATKLRALERHGECRLLLVNACECEPGIACDEALLQHDAASIIDAIGALARTLQAERVAIAIEADKMIALTRLQDALEARRTNGPVDIDLLVFEPLYPSGAEAPLLDAVLAHLSLPSLRHDARPAEQGVLCLNVATVQALGDVLAGRVPATRIVTLAGDTAATSCNARVTFGTPLADVLDAAGWERPHRVRIGGPLSGYASAALPAPVTATVHAVAPWSHADAGRTATGTARPCIRCGDCEPVCPVGLQPQQLHWHATSGDTAALDRLGLGRCLECGCCDVVCPSALPLTETFRIARQQRAHAIAEARDADLAERLAARREARLARDAHRDFSARPAPADRGSADPVPVDRVAAALERARRRAAR